MSLKRLILCFMVVVIVQDAYAQVPKKKYKWKALGPFCVAESDADSADWSSTGMGWIETIYFDKYWYAGSITGGLFQSKNNGKKWKKIDKDNVQMGSLCITKVGNTLFRGTGLTHYDEHFGFGVLKSTNNGRTWSNTGLQFVPSDLKPVWGISGTLKDSLLIACTPNSIYHSHNLGKTWLQMYSERDGDYRTALASKHNNSFAFVGGKHLIRSTDKGISWENITHRLACYDSLGISDSTERIAICEDPQVIGRFLVLYSIGYKLFIDESLDFGMTWANRYNQSTIRGMSIHHTEIAISTFNSNHIIIGGVRTYVSYDNCKSFKQSTYPRYATNNFAHDDIRGIQVTNDNRYVIATDGGIFISGDSGLTWENANGKGLNTTMAYGIELLKDGKVIMGCQDLGTFIYEDKKWLNIASMYGDGGDALELQKGVITMINGKLRLLDLEKLKRHNYVHPPEKKIGNPYSSKVYGYPDAVDTFFYAGVNIWVRENNTWTNLTGHLNGGDFMIGGFDVNRSKPKQMFFAFDEPTWNSDNLKNKLFKTDNGGATWVDITSNLPILAWRSVSSITTNPNNPTEVYVSLAILDDNDIHKVYRSKDGGISWENYSEGLLQYETFKIMHLPNCSGILLSTLDGMYYRNSGMNKWQKIDGKMPNIAVRDFEFDSEKRILYASTYGAGLWKMKMPKKMLIY